MTTAVSSTQTQTIPQTTGTRAGSTSALSSDFDTFLKMLTAQAKYQDPLEPLDSSQYAAQLAQFSMVEQQTMTNDTLTALVEKLGASDMAQLSGWIGQEARAIAPAHFSGEPISVSPAPLVAATRAVMVVRDASGSIVEQFDIPVSAAPVKWSGTDDTGGKLPDGLYSFSVQSYKDDELLLDEAAAAYHQVVEAQIENDDVILVLQGGQAILSSMVTAVRAGS